MRLRLETFSQSLYSMDRNFLHGSVADVTNPIAISKAMSLFKRNLKQISVWHLHNLRTKMIEKIQFSYKPIR